MKVAKLKSNEYSLKKIFRGASAYSIGDILINASGFFLIPIYTRVLTPSDYGIVGFLQVFSGILTVVFSFGFSGAQTRYYYEHRYDEEAVSRFYFTINITTVGFFLVLGLPLILIGSINGWTIGSDNIPFYPYLTITLLSILPNILFGNVTSFLKMKQNFIGVTWINIISFLLTTSFNLLLVVYFKKGALGRITGNTLGLLTIFLPVYIYYVKQFKFKFSKSALKYALGFGFPIVIHLLMGTIHSSIDRIMLEHYLPISELGIYSLGITAAGILQLFVTAFNQAYQPSYYQLMASGLDTIEKHIVTTFKIWLGLLTLATCIGIVIGGPFLTVFAGPKFKEVSSIFPYLLLSVYANSFYYFFSSAIFYYKKTHWLPLITGSSAIVNIIMNLLLIPRYGINGASIATIISHVWISLASYVIGNRLFRVKWPIYCICGSIICVSITFLVVISL